MPSRTYTLAELQALVDNFLRYTQAGLGMLDAASVQMSVPQVLATFLAFVHRSEIAETEVVRQRRYV
jgi:hypothetical protein